MRCRTNRILEVDVIKLLLKPNHASSIGSAVLWSAVYFVLLLSATAINMLVWREIAGSVSVWLNIITIAAFSLVFFLVLKRKTDFQWNLFANASVLGIILAIGCAVLFYLLLDKTLDPIFESLFPASESDYQQALNTLRHTPVSSFFLVCIITPVVEETLMRGYVFGGLYNRYGVFTALFVSSLLFALLHFNMVQTLSALVCGVILGSLYIKTGSLLCCMLAHALYNAISFFTVVYML